MTALKGDQWGVSVAEATDRHIHPPSIFEGARTSADRRTRFTRITGGT